VRFLNCLTFARRTGCDWGVDKAAFKRRANPKMAFVATVNGGRSTDEKKALDLVRGAHPETINASRFRASATMMNKNGRGMMPVQDAIVCRRLAQATGEHLDWVSECVNADTEIVNDPGRPDSRPVCVDDWLCHWHKRELCKQRVALLPPALVLAARKRLSSLYNAHFEWLVDAGLIDP
jgi:hypothetical protein